MGRHEQAHSPKNMYLFFVFTDSSSLPAHTEDERMTTAFMPDNCAIRERTGDGRSVGRCWFHVKDGKCPRHGDVTAVQAHFAETGKLTDENDFPRRVS